MVFRGLRVYTQVRFVRNRVDVVGLILQSGFPACHLKHKRIRGPLAEEAQITSMDPESNLARARELDEQALAAIHDEYYPGVYRYVRYRLEDEQLVEDIAAEVFLRFLDAVRRKGSEIRDVRAWLFGTAANLINDHLRRKYRRNEEGLEENEFLAGLDNTENVAETKDQHRHVREAMRNLTSDQQEVISLRFILDYSVEETAQIMRKTAGAVKVLQFRALASLRRILEGKDHR
jgi:RNA polymerase sigma-70 factor, ECF subfamily